MKRHRTRIHIIPIFIILTLIIASCTIAYRYSQNKYKDINFTAERYLTTGLLNKFKLYKVEKMDISFSDGSLAVITVSGLENKAPHKNVMYKMILEKNKYGVWKVRKVYKNLQDTKSLN
ncbi:hypothetical protein NBE98_01110 [Clostridium swellfunianum]|uniref:hypothetical protein n=1 Tax=Clostridium swellfunianum TaxID=1367462 RepID=UPI00202F3016|nr:hypothetical protein [Clostridium swellfunianum]MCM0646971.1 hypothetical protein [Clostridium swellfunianum]